MIDKDYLKSTNMDYKDGYDKGRKDMAIEAAIAILIVAILVILFK